MMRDHNFRMVLLYDSPDEQLHGLDGQWVVTVTLFRKRGALRKFSFTCEHIASGTVLTYPQDHAKMVGVLPEAMWPQFIKDLTPESPVQDALFTGAGKE